MSQQAEADNSQTLLMDDDQFKSAVGPEAGDVETVAIKQDVQAMNDDVVGQPMAENVRTP